MKARRRRDVEKRGPPIVEIEGVLYVNLSFDLAPMARDIRDVAARAIGARPRDLLVLARLTKPEATRVRRALDDAAVEAWAGLDASNER